MPRIAGWVASQVGAFIHEMNRSCLTDSKLSLGKTTQSGQGSVWPCDASSFTFKRTTLPRMARYYALSLERDLLAIKMAKSKKARRYCIASDV